MAGRGCAFPGLGARALVWVSRSSCVYLCTHTHTCAWSVEGAIVCCCFSGPSGKKRLRGLFHTRTIPKSVGTQGSRDSGGTGRGGQLGMTTRGVWAGNTPSLLSTVWQKLSYVGDMKVKQNALRSVTLSAGCAHCPTQGKQSLSSLGPATDPCLMSSFSPGGGCLEALSATAGDPRSCCMDPINCALLGGKGVQVCKGSSGAFSGPRASSVHHKTRDKG